eukprot:6022542-Pleurochrysis_carterae.AAC.1
MRCAGAWLGGGVRRHVEAVTLLFRSAFCARTTLAAVPVPHNDQHTLMYARTQPCTYLCRHMRKRMYTMQAHVQGHCRADLHAHWCTKMHTHKCTHSDSGIRNTNEHQAHKQALMQCDKPKFTHGQQGRSE